MSHFRSIRKGCRKILLDRHMPVFTNKKIELYQKKTEAAGFSVPIKFVLGIIATLCLAELWNKKPQCLSLTILLLKENNYHGIKSVRTCSIKKVEVVGRAFFLFPHFQLGTVKVALQAGYFRIRKCFIPKLYLPLCFIKYILECSEKWFKNFFCVYVLFLPKRTT